MSAWFSLSLTESDTAPFLADGKLVVIGELEAIVPIISLRLWRDYLTQKHLVAYLDNEGAKFALVKGISKSRMISCIAFRTAELLEDLHCIPWFARVPTPSNVADAPSRDLLPIAAGVPSDEVRVLFELEVSSLCAMAHSPHPLERGGSQGEANALDTPNIE